MAILDDDMKVVEEKKQETRDCPFTACVDTWLIIYHCFYQSYCINILPLFMVGKLYLQLVTMEEEFEIPVTYNNQQLFFRARRLIMGSYTQKIQVDVYGTEVFFEVDEERNYRAYIDPTNTEAIDKVDKDLLQQIVEAIESVRK